MITMIKLSVMRCRRKERGGVDEEGIKRMRRE
jgi:hypothetical protein